MPYFVYKIAPGRVLTHIDTKDSYKQAREIVRTLRRDKAADDAADYRMAFTQHQAEAEKLLSKPPDGRVIGED